MLVAQISDLHVGLPGHLAFDRIDASACLARCVAHILGLRPRPDLVVASGDLVDLGTTAEYRRLRELLAPLPMPVYLMPGNHDDRAALRTEFGDHGYLPAHGTLHYSLDTEAMQLIMLDTVVPGADGGALGASQMKWLATKLAAARDRPVLVFMHHPPIMTGIRCMDEIALAADDIAALGALVARSAQVERISCGHVHRTVEARWNGTVVGICPSTAFQGVLGLKNEGFALAAGEPPSYQLHHWNGRHLVTHTVQMVEPGG